MIYLYWYLGLGAVVAVFVLVNDYLKKEPVSDSMCDVFETGYPERKKLSYRLLNNIVVPALIAVAIIAIWPITLYLHIQELFVKKDIITPPVFTEPPDFTVEREHLQERLTVDEVEKREFVIDPLNAVPDVPFGHLNAAWYKFLESRCENTELWSFSALWSTTWGDTELRSGYAIVENDVPPTHFLTVRKELPKKAETD